MAGDDDGEPGTASETGRSAVEEATVLVVDDERPVLDSFEHALESAGYGVVTARNGGEALVELGPEIDVVLLDRRMPGMSGDEVLDHLTEWRMDCRVVMVTAVDPDADIVEMSFDDYLTKPVNQSELVDTIEQLLLFDRYEELLSAYHAKTRKYATLQAAFEDHEMAESETVRTLEAGRETVRAELEATIDEFSDAEIREVLQRAHGDLPRAESGSND